MSAPQIVFAAASALVVAAIALVCAGVALLAGAGWALIVAGLLIGPCSVAAAVALLHEDGASQ